MVTRHADDDGAPLCGETVADSTGLVVTVVEHLEVECRECRDALGLDGDPLHPWPFDAIEVEAPPCA